MTAPFPGDHDQAVLADPATPADALQLIAAQRPDLWAQIAAHPNAYPGLLDWLDERGDAEVRAAVAARLATDSATEPDPQPLSVHQHSSLWQSKFPTTPDRTRLLLLIGIPALIVVIIVGVMLVLVMRTPSQPQNQDNFADALADFNTAVSTYDTAQTGLTQAITDAGSATSLTAADVADPTVLTTLANALGTATSAVAPAPAPSGALSDLRAQITELQAKTASTTSASTALTAAVTAARASQATAAKDALTAAIAQAQQAHDSPPAKADPDVVAALATQITQAQAALATLPTDDGATASATAKQWQQTLSQAETAVASSAVPCGGVTVPRGVNSTLVCGDMPSGAVSMPGDIFSLPSKNIGCSYALSVLMCQVLSHSWAIPAQLCQASGGTTCEDGIVTMTADGVRAVPSNGSVVQSDWFQAQSSGTDVPTLQYGRTANFGGVACQSSQSGVLCWDTTTHHGFLMSNRALTSW